MTATQDQSKTMEALLQTPIAQAALAEAEAAGHARRRDALERLAIAERERAQAVAAAGKRLPELREAHREARRRLRQAAAALHEAECHVTDLECAGDSRCAAVRRELGELGDGAIEALRATLAVEQRIAANVDSYRQTATPDPRGGLGYAVARVDNGGGGRLLQIAAAHAELDAMSRDAALSPAAITRRCDELRAELEGGPLARPPASSRTFPKNPGAKTDRAVVAEAIRRVFRR